MKPSPKLLDVVALVQDFPDQELLAGQVGTVVEILSADACEVEFVDEQGQTYAQGAFKNADLMVLRYSPVQVAS